MSFADSLSYPRKLTIVRPSEDQSPYTRFLNFSGSYNGFLAGAVVAFPKMSPGAQIMMLRKQLTWGQAGGAPTQSISNALINYWIGNAFGHWPNVSMTFAYVPIIDNSSSGGTWENLWSSDGWDPDAQPQVQNTNTQTTGGVPYTISGRSNAMYMELVRNTTSVSSVAISGTCNAVRVDDLELYGGVDLSSQYCKRFASPDKDYACNLPQQTGVCSIGACDYGKNFTAINPWQSASSQENEVMYRSRTIEMQIPSVGTIASFGSTLPAASDFQYNANIDYPGSVSPQQNWWAFTTDPSSGGGGALPPQDILGSIPISSGSVVLQMFISPYVTSTSTNENQSRIVDKCPAANPFDTPTITVEWRVATALEHVRCVIKAVHVFAQHSAAVSNTEDTQTIYDTVCMVKETRINGNGDAGWQKMSTTFERPTPVYTENTNFTQAKPRCGQWIGCMFFMYTTQATETQPIAYFERYTTSYRFKVENPAHVCSWDKRAVTDVVPITVSGSVFAEVKLSNEARTYSNISAYQRSSRFDDMLDAQREFMVTQSRKSSYDKKTYDEEERGFADAIGK